MTYRRLGRSGIELSAVGLAEGAAAGISSELVQYSMLALRPEEEILETARRAGLGVLVRGAVAGSDKEMAQTAIRFALSHPAVTAVAAGSSSVAQVEANFNAANAPPLGEADQSALRDAVRPLRYTSHR